MSQFDPKLLVIVPLLGVIGGGIYSVPISFITKGKEPYTSVLCVPALMITPAIIGYFKTLSIERVFIIWITGLIVYLGLQLLKSWRHCIESFFASHMFMLVTAFWMVILPK